MNKILRNILICTSLAGLKFCPTLFAAAAPKPNIIFILADDYGVGEVSAYGADNYK
ncbi:MAG: sulfatase, partial [Opitutaceae bacterium]|nr:sulfatase [Opitutaceae bacterium]